MGNCRVTIVGLDGVGALVAEALARSGIGSLFLIDTEKVVLEDTHNLFYSTCDVHASRLQTVVQKLQSINGDVKIEILEGKVTEETMQDAWTTWNDLNNNDINCRDSAFVICNLKKEDATCTNTLALQHNVPLLRITESSDGMGGTLHWTTTTTACLECHNETTSPKNTNRTPICLPSTQALLAGLASHHLFKYVLFAFSILFHIILSRAFLHFGQCPSYISTAGSHDAMSSIHIIEPDSGCRNVQCQLRQTTT